MAGFTCLASFLCPSRLFLLLLFVESFYIALETALGPGWGSWPSFGNSKGCRPDGEGTWSIGIYKGTGPFSLVPLEDVVPRIDTSVAWPVANPVLTCASVSDAPSNFVADPFLFQGADGLLYLFYETKNSDTEHGDIGVAESRDGGATWQHLAIVLDEPWHLSYPFVFEHEGEIYMMPEGSSHGDLRLYRALSFPTRWTLEKVLLKRPMVDASLLQHNGSWYLFSADKTRPGVTRNAFLEIWHSASPLGPWKQHRMNPILFEHRGAGARMAGRPFSYNGQLFRFGQDCGRTYGGAVRAFRIDSLSQTEFSETEVPSGFAVQKKGGKLWNGVRHHHVDVQQLPSGDWIAAVDGDHVPSGVKSRVFLQGVLWAFGFCVLNTLLLAACKAFPVERPTRSLLRRVLGLRCVQRLLPVYYQAGHFSQNGSFHGAGFKGSALLPRSNSGGMGSRPFFWNPLLCWLQSSRSVPLSKGKAGGVGQWRRYSSYVCLAGLLVLSGLLVLGIGELFYSLLGNSSSNMPFPVQGQFSKFSLVCMSYDARLANLKLFVRHYSRCSSVGEIVVVWNNGAVPNISDFDSAAPLRFRQESVNSLNNRFRPDPLIRNRAVMELDDDIWMSCGDLERGFARWRKHPERIVGYYPRLADGNPLLYRGEQYAFERGRYNMVLTGAAFLDSEAAFPRYFSEENRPVREIVDELFNCEDLAMNYVLGVGAPGYKTIDYVRPNLRVDMSKVSSVGISRNSEEHARRRSECLQRLAEHFGRDEPLPGRRFKAARPNYFPALSPWRESSWGYDLERHHRRKHRRESRG